MAIQQIKMFLHYQPESWRDDDDKWGLYASDMSSHGDILVKEVMVSVDVPDSFDPIPKQVEMLKAKRQELETKFNAETTRIDTELSKLLAIACEPDQVL